MDEVQNRYNQVRNTVFSQNIEGEYVKRNKLRSSKILFILGILNLGVGLSVLFSAINNTIITIPYDKMSVNKNLYLKKGTYYLYIEINELYQNYLGYTKSISYPQLRGEVEKLNLKDLKPFDQFNGVPYYPAGTIAFTYFQDDIKIDNLEIETDDISLGSGKKLIDITSYLPGEFVLPKTWSLDTNKDTKALNFEDENDYLPILNERFVNWITLAFSNNFKKLWGRIKVEDSGEYNLSVDSKYDFGKFKNIIISEKSSIGIVNYYVVYTLLGVGIVSILGALYMKIYGY